MDVTNHKIQILYIILKLSREVDISGPFLSGSWNRHMFVPTIYIVQGLLQMKIAQWYIYFYLYEKISIDCARF